MFKFYQKIILQQFKGLNRSAPLVWYNGFASATIAETKNVPRPEEDKLRKTPQNTERENKMVQRVFATIKLEDNDNEIQTPSTDNKLLNAKTVDELLSVSEGVGVSRHHAFQVVSILSKWTTNSQVTLQEFENDPRFLRLCKVLTRNVAPKIKKTGTLSAKSEDLSTVMSVAADDEAAKLVENITLSQMVKVLVTLSVKKRRSTLLLRSLAFNIAGSTEKLNIKECADLFYSIASLNFYDENLFEKAASNVITLLETENITKSSVIGSILTSVGLLKYKNPALLDAISTWVTNNRVKCRSQDIFSLFMTLGVLNYTPVNAEKVFKVLVPELSQEEVGRPGVWLELVWSLVLLDQANHGHIASVLNENFITQLKERRSWNTSAVLKLLNIDGMVQHLLNNYDGPRLDRNSDLLNTDLLLSKEKQHLFECLIDSLKTLIPENYFKTRVNTGLGFYIDAECALDSTCNPIPLDQAPPEGRNPIKVAILLYDYHDVCKGKTGLTGVNVLCEKLLKAMGYRIVSVPYTDFKTTDKVVTRVQYLENKLKEVVK